jgi:hypothetical protein
VRRILDRHRAERGGPNAVVHRFTTRAGEGQDRGRGNASWRSASFGDAESADGDVVLVDAAPQYYWMEIEIT